MTAAVSNPGSESNWRQRQLRVRIVLDDPGWIIEKFAVRLAENLPHWNVQADIADQPSAAADLNHYVMYHDIIGHSDEDLGLRSTILVTHVDRRAKLLILKARLKTVEMGICMSRMCVEDLIAEGLDRRKLCYVTPAHDGAMHPRRIVLGITSRLRPDGAKREDILLAVAKAMPMHAFHFDIIGRGWEKVVPELEAAGATVNYFPGTNDGVADYRVNLERVPHFDYYLYMAFDDGSMGFLDALAAGIPTIITPDGYHLDVKGGITYPFRDARELRGVLEKIVAERQARIDSVAGLTWNEYARKHSLIWHALIAGRRDDLPALLYNTAAPAPSAVPTPGAPARYQLSRHQLLNPSARLIDGCLLLRHYLGFRNYARLRKLGRMLRLRRLHS